MRSVFVPDPSNIQAPQVMWPSKSDLSKQFSLAITKSLYSETVFVSAAYLILYFQQVEVKELYALSFEVTLFA